MSNKHFRPSRKHGPAAECHTVTDLPATEPRSGMLPRPRGIAANGSAPSIDPLAHAGPDPARLARELDEARQRNRALEERVRTLEEAVAARDTLIATAGHELRNPMAAIVVTVTNMHFLAKREAALPGWVHHRLDVLERQARTFVRRATTLLDISRLTAGQPCPDRERVSLSTLVREMVNETAFEAERAGCEVRLAIGEDVTGIWDRAAIEQIALNLLSNAIKYGAGRPIEVAVTSEGPNALLRVRDHGVGIPADDLGRIFERFERAVLRGERPGFGLGLWIARRLALAHDGEISVESTPGIGSLFTASLPRGIT